LNVGYIFESKKVKRLYYLEKKFYNPQIALQRRRLFHVGATSAFPAGNLLPVVRVVFMNLFKRSECPSVLLSFLNDSNLSQKTQLVHASSNAEHCCCRRKTSDENVVTKDMETKVIFDPVAFVHVTVPVEAGKK